MIRSDYIALGIGCIVGYAVRIGGKGIDRIFGISGAIIAGLACFVGNFISIIILFAKGLDSSISYVLKLFGFFGIIGTFDRVDLLFCGLAIYAGYKFSFCNITEKDIENLQNNK